MPVHTQIAAAISSTAHHRSSSTSSQPAPHHTPYHNGRIGKASELEGLASNGYAPSASYGSTLTAQRNGIRKGKEPENVYDAAVGESGFTYDYEVEMSDDGEELVDGEC